MLFSEIKQDSFKTNEPSCDLNHNLGQIHSSPSMQSFLTPNWCCLFQRVFSCGQAAFLTQTNSYVNTYISSVYIWKHHLTEPNKRHILLSYEVVPVGLSMSISPWRFSNLCCKRACSLIIFWWWNLSDSNSCFISASTLAIFCFISSENDCEYC